MSDFTPDVTYGRFCSLERQADDHEIRLSRLAERVEKNILARGYLIDQLTDRVEKVEKQHDVLNFSTTIEIDTFRGDLKDLTEKLEELENPHPATEVCGSDEDSETRWVAAPDHHKKVADLRATIKRLAEARDFWRADSKAYESKLNEAKALLAQVLADATIWYSEESLQDIRQFLGPPAISES